MVDVPIEYSYTLHVVLCSEVLYADGHIVVHAEAIDSITRSAVMSGWTNDGEGISPFSFLDLVKALNDPTYCQMRSDSRVLIVVGV